MGAIRPEFQNFDNGEFTTPQELEAALPKVYDAYNPSPTALAKAAALQSIAQQVSAAEMASQQPLVKDKAYYRKRFTAGHEGRRECEAHRLSLKMSQDQYSRWIWGDDKPQQAAPSATPEALAWAEKVLAG